MHMRQNVAYNGGLDGVFQWCCLKFSFGIQEFVKTSWICRIMYRGEDGLGEKRICCLAFV